MVNMLQRYRQFWGRVGFVVGEFVQSSCYGIIGAVVGIVPAMMSNTTTWEARFNTYVIIGFSITWLFGMLYQFVPAILKRLDFRWQRMENHRKMTVWDEIARAVLFALPWAFVGIVAALVIWKLS